LSPQHTIGNGGVSDDLDQRGSVVGLFYCFNSSNTLPVHPKVLLESADIKVPALTSISSLTDLRRQDSTPLGLSPEAEAVLPVCCE